KEKRGNSRWKRSFPHERGNWPTYVYIADPLILNLLTLYVFQVHNWQGKRTDRHLLGGGPVEVVVNDFESEGVQHLSLSKTFVLRAHQIQSFNKALAESVKFTIVVTGDYDVLVNEDRTRSFLCLRTAGGSRQVQGLVDKVDQLLKRYNKPTYYEVQHAFFVFLFLMHTLPLYFL
ncbi:unnamed protein product, partial [Discosporangium mesarthrocarpum]